MRRSSQRLWLITLVLMVAVVARLWQFGEAPPGMQHDEFFKANEAERIVRFGDVQLFYPTNQGHEGGYIWLSALSYALFGKNMLMVRMPPFWLGLLMIAWLYRFGRSVYGFRVGVWSAGLAAVCFWWVFTNRVGLRANFLPLVTLMVLWGLWRLCYAHPDQSGKRWQWALWVGMWLGFAIYTYTASLTLYLALGFFAVALMLFDRPVLRRRGAELLLAAVIGGVLTLPMVHIRLNNPQGQNRANSINVPWQEFRDGNPDPLLKNARKLVGMALFEGDPEARYNLPKRPLFIVPVGVAVYGGLILLLARRRPLDWLLVGLAVMGLIPSLLTTSAPSFLRSINTLPALMIAFALTLNLLSGRLAWGVALSLIVATAVLDGRAFFGEWANREDVAAIYRDDLEVLADYLRDTGEDRALVSTNTPHILDSSLYSYYNPPTKRPTWFDGRVSIVLGRHDPYLLFVSPLAPISPAHAVWLEDAESLAPLYQQNGRIAFEVYRLNPAALEAKLADVAQSPVYLAPTPPFPSDQLADWGVRYDYPVNFGGILQLIGVEMPRTALPFEDNRVDNGLNLQLYFEPLIEGYGESVSVFVHLISWAGDLATSRDFLGVPAYSWQLGTIFIQDNYIGNYSLEPRPYFVAVGLYNTLTGQRYPILDADGTPLSDQVILGQLTIGPRED